MIGFDMTAALAVADSMGLRRDAVTELLPLIENVMVAEIRAAREDGT